MKIVDLSHQSTQSHDFSYNASVSHLIKELLAGYRTDLTTLVNGAIFEGELGDLVVVKDIEFTSLCEHHLLPFHGLAHASSRCTSA